MANTIIKGRPAHGAVVEGEAIVCPNSIQGWSGFDTKTGVIIEKGHVHEGDSVAGKILVVPCSRGSVGWSMYAHWCALNGVGPKGYIVTKMDTKCGTAVILTDVPCVTDFPEGVDPCAIIHSGDYIRLDGEKGTVEILKKAK